MKRTKKSISIIILNFIAIAIFAQTPANITTPQGSLVLDTYILPEFTSAQIASANNYIASIYPNATALTNSSNTYNCHAYAWHITVDGNNVWLGAYTETAEDVYWNDGSYVLVCNPQQYPAKVSYPNGNHSAVTTANAGIFRSKWGPYPVMDHPRWDLPYRPLDSLTKSYLY